MNKLGIMACLGLALSACACGPGGDLAPKPTASTSDKPVEKRMSADQIQFGKGTAEQAVRLRWIRPGTWNPVKMDVVGAPPVAAMISTDAMGSRIVALHGNAGYDVLMIDLQCDKSNYAVTGARRSERDDRPPVKDVKAGRSRVTPSEIRRVCEASKSGGLKGSTYDAVAALRQAGPLPLAPSGKMPAAPSAAERAKAWEAYKARNGVQ